MEQISLLDWTPPARDREGSTYEAAKDFTRLNAQETRVWQVVCVGEWFSLGEIAAITNDPEASISARLRGFRSHGLTVERRRRADAGLYEYRVLA